jgi:aspartyl-tRNA(Asn)/glutamyl-tRNA(Gln) amidotransferase subunit A
MTLDPAATLSPIAALRQQYLRGEADPVAVLDAALARANSNAGHNVYLAQDAAWSHAEAARLDPARIPEQPLWGIPISLKDCFDLAGFPTTCGADFLRASNTVATADSTVAARLRAAGAVITGKTHLHQLAYGITGENAAFGDCLQPRDPATLTGGSSSGAAASVQEGSALAAIGTDTGGSVRAPAALCGLAGYRSSITINATARGHDEQDVWQGGHHLAPSFDTVGWLYRDLRDGPVLGHALFHLPLADAPAAPRIGLPDAAFFHDCEPAVLATLDLWKRTLAAHGATVHTFDPALWADATAIIAPIQAHEAAQLHRGRFHLCEPAIADRLAWGASITDAELTAHLARREAFRAQTYALFDRFDLLLLPCTPMTSLAANADHTETRARILRYTSPISLTGLPVVTLPGPGPQPTGGLQLVGPLNSDATLLALSAALV